MKLKRKYFVLKPRNKFKLDILAGASRAAMSTYAKVIRKKYPIFAGQINDWVEEELRYAIEQFHEGGD